MNFIISPADYGTRLGEYCEYALKRGPAVFQAKAVIPTDSLMRRDGSPGRLVESAACQVGFS
jgi:hypothetical protein